MGGSAALKLPPRLQPGDLVAIAAPGSAFDRAAQLDESDRLDPQRLVREIAASGRRARQLQDVDAIAAAVLADLRPGDVVAVLSNGSFGGLIPRLRGEFEAWVATQC